jgi:hypothetical protein
VQSPGSFFKGFEGAPWSGVVTDLNDEVQLEVMIEGMRAWANTQEPKPEAGPLVSEASLVVFPELL